MNNNSLIISSSHSERERERERIMNDWTFFCSGRNLSQSDWKETLLEEDHIWVSKALIKWKLSGVTELDFLRLDVMWWYRHSHHCFTTPSRLCRSIFPGPCICGYQGNWHPAASDQQCYPQGMVPVSVFMCSVIYILHFLFNPLLCYAGHCMFGLVLKSWVLIYGHVTLAACWSYLF